MSVATALFFMVGFLTCLNDIVSPHLKSIFDLDYAQTQLVPFFFFSSYFVFSYPAAKSSSVRLQEDHGRRPVHHGLRRARLPSRRAPRLSSHLPGRAGRPRRRA
jgi:hypothetical protein